MKFGRIAVQVIQDGIYMTLFDAEKFCHLVNAHSVSVQRSAYAAAAEVPDL